MSQANSFDITVERNLRYADHGGETLTGSFYRPLGEGPHPVVVALHGGGWRNASATIYDHLGPWLAHRGYAVFAPVYRVASAGKKTFPEALHDVRAAIQFVRGRADALRLNPDRIALMGESAGGHLAALVALAGDDPAVIGEAPRRGAYADLPTRVRAAIPVYGVFDLVAQWRHDLLSRPADQQIVNLFVGTSPLQNRRIFFEASPLSHVLEANNETAFLVAWGRADDVVDPATQSQPFVEALKQAGFFVRTTVLNEAPHYWLGEPLEETGSFPGFFAPRLLRFLRARV